MSLFWRQFLQSFIIIFLVLFLFTFLIISELKKYDRSITKERLLTTATLTADILGPYITGNDPKDIQPIVRQLGAKTGVWITVVQGSGVVLADSENDPKEMDNHSKRPEILQAQSEGKGESKRYNPAHKRDMLYTAIPISVEGSSTSTIVRTALLSNPLDETLGPIESKIIYVGLLLTLIALLLSYLLTKTFTDSLRTVINASGELAKGNFDVNIPLRSGKGEISKLHNVFKQMTDKLNDFFNQLSEEKNQLEAVLSAMSEGVVVVANNSNVILINNALKKMFEITEPPDNKPYWEVLRNKEVIQLVEEAILNRVHGSKEIYLVYPDDRYYLANVIPLESPGEEIIVVMFDITEFKRLENIKADFIANVSHELRTPLTAIKGYTETIEEGAYKEPQELNHFLNIIKRHTDRLIHIVSDLLVLSEIEGKDSLARDDQSEDIELLDINEIISSSLEALKSNITEKNIKVSLNSQSDLPKCRANRLLLEQVFINLLDNATKYSTDNGNIEISVESPDNSLRIEIADNGIGIPKEHLPRIFERFYRVDKTRSRKIGGTGLGLSIVKHIVLMHGGKIEVESEEGNGSKFIISLPL